MLEDPTLGEWFLTAEERGNPDTALDARHPDGLAWTTGNLVRPLVHGRAYFSRLLEIVETLGENDLLLFTDWRGDLDQRLDGAGSEVGRVLGRAAARGAVVRGLMWRSHLELMSFSSRPNRRLAEELNTAGAQVVLDHRVHRNGSHHQKLVIARRAAAPEDTAGDTAGDAVAFAGGIDLCYSRRDDAAHAGDPQSQPIADTYGAAPPWHDIQAEVRGPAVGDLEVTFRERWDDPSALDNPNPIRQIFYRIRPVETNPDGLPPQAPDPAPVGPHAVQILRTYPRRRPHYPFARKGERSIARAYRKVLRRARRLIYLEDQYMWSTEVARLFADALRREPELHLVIVVPRFPTQGGRFSLPPNLVGREKALEICRAAGGDRVAVYDVENHAGTPVYVHSKAVTIDDVWASIGSDNLNRRSWSHDSELAVATIDTTLDPREPHDPGGLGDGARVFARDLRLELWREHLDWDGDDDELIDPEAGFKAFRRRADELDAWHRGGQAGPRPPGRIRPHQPQRLGRLTRGWSAPLYHAIYDPDGRPRRMRRDNAW
ncbi:phospholipase D-like domain-containing protein [Frankia sp. Mgl5]|uniref:phospholipase D-like domain-containing protein n=1 Tax=Frankia sp. Mgl5 TaxID=2933793 RepID=UPI00200EF8AB|nr:phospholipase D-like domain-containing protein [Frankia sp. Mgl5]MCK9932609.1 phospholipase D-like domain-containing protein [Frankia sp. Mgl5]